MTSRLAQTAALIVASPLLWAFGLVTFTLVSLGNTATAIWKVWK